MEFEKLLRLMVEKGGSDLFITAGVPPSMKVNGRVMPVTKTPLSPEQTRETVLGVMNEQQRRDFAENHECNFAISARGIGRFRVSAFYQRNLVGMVLRRIETNIPTLEELKLPEILKKLALTKRGLVIFVGATGTGKSTSLAAMIGYRNKNSTGHIISIEDPIEYIHQHQGCIVTQREVGLDTDLRGGAEEHPAPGAGRDHDRRGALAGDHGPCRGLRRDRPPVPGDPAREQRQPGAGADHPLLPGRPSWPGVDGPVAEPQGHRRPATGADPDGKGRRAVIEVLLNTPLAADLIRKGEVHELKPLMKRSTEQGMQTFDQALYQLYTQGEITYEDALAHADSANDLRLMIKLGSESDADHLSNLTQGLSLEITDDDPAGRRFR